MISKIELFNYRNIHLLTTEFKRSNLIIASNGTGKTNFLESIYYAITGKSIKNASTIKELMGPFHEKYTKIHLYMKDNSEIECVLENKIQQSIRKILKNNGKSVQQKELYFNYPILYFSPNSVSIIEGEPNLRRNEVDHFLSILDRKYFEILVKYKEVLKHKNKVLEKIKKGEKSFVETKKFLDEQQIECGSYIISQRKDIIKLISPMLNNLITENKLFTAGYRYISTEEKEIIQLVYKTNIKIDDNQENIKENFRQKIIENEQKEFYMGTSLYGPHKDDIEILLNNKNIKYFGSRGQQRIITILLKISEIEIYYKKTNKYPFLLIDDLMSELDRENKYKMSKILENNEISYILTSTTTQDINNLMINSKIISLR